MKAISVRYERLYNVGNYEHAKFGVELVVEDGEKAADVMATAKRFVRSQHIEALEREKAKIERARFVLENRRNHLVSEVEDAEKTVAAFEAQQQEEFPF